MNNLQEKSLIVSLFSYLKFPKYTKKNIDIPFKQKLRDVFRYWSLGLVVAFVLGIFISIALSSPGNEGTENHLSDFFSDSSVVLIIIMIFFFGPLVEEVTFRLALRFSPYNLAFFLLFALSLLLKSSNPIVKYLDNIIFYLDKYFGFWLMILFVLLLFVSLGLAL